MNFYIKHPSGKGILIVMYIKIKANLNDEQNVVFTKKYFLKYKLGLDPNIRVSPFPISLTVWL